MTAPEQAPEQHDLRLALPAAAAWVVAWQSRLLDPGLVVTAAVVVALGGLFLLRRRRSALVAAVLICAAAAGIATAARVHARSTGPLVTAARTQAAVTVEGVLVDDPRAVPKRQDVLSFQQLVVATVRVERLTVGGRTVRLREPVLLLSSDEHWLGLLPSQHVRSEGRLDVAGPGDDVAALLSGRGPPVLIGGPSHVERLAGRLRAGLRSAASVLPADERGLLPGLVDGDTSRLDPGLSSAFQATGLTHVVAVSGSNVAIVLAAALLVLGWIGVPLRLRPPLAGLALLAFVVLARPSPSVLRAAAMGVVALLALAVGARRQALPALGAAVLGLVLLSPDLAAAPGFALSTLATAGLLVLAPPWRARLAERMPGWLADAIAVPAAAQVACGPVIVAISGQLGLLAVPANLLAVPAVAPATVLGVLAALVAPVWLPAAQGLAWLAWLPTHWLVLVARTGARQPGAQLSIASGWAGALVALALTALVGLVLRHRALRRAAVALAVGVLLAAGTVIVLAAPWPPRGWVLASCDVGQGDGFVVRLGPGRALVIDTGPDPEPIDRCLHDLGITKIPLLVLTHLHADHIEGVPGLLRHRSVGQVEIGPLDEPVVEKARLMSWLGTRRIPWARASIGEVRQDSGVRWEVLDATDRHGTDSDPNNSSIVLKLWTHGISVLFAGDLEGDAQQELLDRGLDLQATILKVPHHGSRKQDPAFLDAVHEQIALTPVGAHNPYGHPAVSTMQRLAQDGARVYRSDRDGDVAIIVKDGHLSSQGRGGSGTRLRPTAQPAVLVSPTGLLTVLLPDTEDRCDAAEVPAPARPVLALARAPPVRGGPHGTRRGRRRSPEPTRAARRVTPSAAPRARRCTTPRPRPDARRGGLGRTTSRLAAVGPARRPGRRRGDRARARPPPGAHAARSARASPRASAYRPASSTPGGTTGARRAPPRPAGAAARAPPARAVARSARAPSPGRCRGATRTPSPRVARPLPEP